MTFRELTAFCDLHDLDYYRIIDNQLIYQTSHRHPPTVLAILEDGYTNNVPEILAAVFAHKKQKEKLS